jgi:hypothetical protein
MKIGMKHLRDGRIGRVPYIQPDHYGSKFRVLLEYLDSEGKVCFDWLMFNGLSSCNYEYGIDIVEHLSDTLHDLKTWVPVKRFCEGLWRRADGSIDLLVGDPNYITCVYMCRISGPSVDSYFRWDDLCSSNNPYEEYIGPNPLRKSLES